MFIVNLSVFAQKSACNIKNGFAVAGYDLISYFDGKAVKGKLEHVFIYNDIKYQFSTNKNLNKFKSNPEKYLPQYGGWCAYAMGKKGKKVDMDPKIFEIRDDKLYLFYNSYFNNTYKKWINEDTQKLQQKADVNWRKVIRKE